MAGLVEKLSWEFNKTESHICNLGALSKLDEVLMNPQVRTLSGTVPETSLNNHLENREATGDRSQSYRHPKVEFFACPTSNSVNSVPVYQPRISFFYSNCSMFVQVDINSENVNVTFF